MTTILTGFPNLDTLIGGFQQEDMILLTTPSTSNGERLALSIVLNVARRYAHPVGLFTLEMSKYHVVQHLLALMTNMKVERLRTGCMNTDEYENVAKAAKRLSQMKLWINDSANLSVEQLHQRAQCMVKAHDIAFLMIENIHCIQPRVVGQCPARWIPESEEVMNMLKSLAKTTHIPVLGTAPIPPPKGLCSTSARILSERSNCSRKREADHALFLYRDDVSQPFAQDKRSPMTSLFIANHQNGFVTDVVIVPNSHQKYSPSRESVQTLPSKNSVAS